MAEGALYWLVCFTLLRGLCLKSRSRLQRDLESCGKFMVSIQSRISSRGSSLGDIKLHDPDDPNHALSPLALGAGAKRALAATKVIGAGRAIFAVFFGSVRGQWYAFAFSIAVVDSHFALFVGVALLSR